ncbi:MAG: DNA gyrase inhibitor YacG [Planctomycetes bacterium]|nr:DNA gyrase inhibitor YacG [Planctomycetota bacterium]
MNKVRCPICDRELLGPSTTEWPQFPFCSVRCRLIDLGRWLGERYRISPETEGEDPAESCDESATP